MIGDHILSSSVEHANKEVWILINILFDDDDGLHNYPSVLYNKVSFVSGRANLLPTLVPEVEKTSG